VFCGFSLGHVDGPSLSSDLHDVTLAIVERVLKAPDPAHRERHSYSRRDSLAEGFGLDAHLDHNWNPASALHGPFANLLAAHPRDGLRLIVDTLNRISATYVASRGQAFEFSFAIGDGKTVRHRGDGALWAMYRINCGPDIVRSMLMALERWLLQVGELDTRLLCHVLLQLMETVGLIHSRGHSTRGGYDGNDGWEAGPREAGTTTVHG